MPRCVFSKCVILLSYSRVMLHIFVVLVSVVLRYIALRCALLCVVFMLFYVMLCSSHMFHRHLCIMCVSHKVMCW